MKKRLFVLLALFSFVAAQADEAFLGLYMGGNKIGYSVYSSHPEMYENEKVTRNDSTTVMDLGMLGSEMRQTIDSSSWTAADGRPRKMLFTQSSQGRTQKVVAIYGSKTAEVDIQTGGKTVHKSLPIPTSGSIVDDPLELVVGGKAVPGQKMTVYVLDPTTATFIKNEVVLVGPRKATLNGREVSATLVQIVDPRVTMDVYVDAKGGLVKVDGPMGIEMLPETREMALSNQPSGYKPSADLAFATSLRPNKSIANPETLTGLTLKITGRDLSGLPSDEHQGVRKQGAGWIVDVHPPQLATAKSATISQAGKQKPEWLQPTLNIPSDSQTFKDLSRKIVKGETRVIPAALAIKSFVFAEMHPNAGIGVLRDASEVLSSKEGVCRDYAILTVTLMRAAGIPAKLCSGVVNWQGAFYYHAWAEVWDGKNWIGIDSTVAQKQLSAGHLKLAQGNVEQAFAFTFLDKVKIEVLDIRRK